MIENPFNDKSVLTVLSMESDWSHAESCIGTLVQSPNISNPRRYRQHVMGNIAAYSSIGVLNSRHGYRLFDFQLKRNSAGIPIWPQGFVGSISHSSDLVGALVAPHSDVRSVGLDIQKVVPLRKNIAKRIANPSELDWISQSPEQSALRSLILFSAKECYFKAVVPSLGHSVNYRDIQIKLDKSDKYQIFNAGMRSLGNYPKGWPLSQPIYVQVVDNYIVAITVVPHYSTP